VLGLRDVYSWWVDGLTKEPCDAVAVNHQLRVSTAWSLRGLVLLHVLNHAPPPSRPLSANPIIPTAPFDTRPAPLPTPTHVQDA